MGENLSEAPKASLWVENLHGGSPLSFKIREKELYRYISASLCFLCLLFCMLLMVSGNTGNHSSYFPLFYLNVHPIINSIHLHNFLHHLHTPHFSIPEHNVARAATHKQTATNIRKFLQKTKLFMDCQEEQ